MTKVCLSGAVDRCSSPLPHQTYNVRWQQGLLGAWPLFGKQPNRSRNTGLIIVDHFGAVLDIP